jgi:hypothetical protein
VEVKNIDNQKPQEVDMGIDRRSVTQEQRWQKIDKRPSEGAI